MTKHEGESKSGGEMVRSSAFATFLLALAASCFAQEHNHPTLLRSARYEVMGIAVKRSE